MTSTALDTRNGVASLTADPPGKINLSLEVLGRRDDGYHEIRSLALGVDLRDRLTCTRRPNGEFTVICCDSSSHADVGVRVHALHGDDNLALRAARRLAEAHSRAAGVAIELHKNIPLAAGLGGGSSDAAAALALCNRLWSLGLDDAELAAIGAGIGSDVPLFFALPAAFVRGRGEQVRRVQLRWRGWVLLISVEVEVSTPGVYDAWRPGDSVARRAVNLDGMLEAASADDLMDRAANHLEPAIFRTVGPMAAAREALQSLDLGLLRISGAGSTFYRLFDDYETANRAAAKITSAGLPFTTRVVAAPVANTPWFARSD